MPLFNAFFFTFSFTLHSLPLVFPIFADLLLSLLLFLLYCYRCCFVVVDIRMKKDSKFGVRLFREGGVQPRIRPRNRGLCTKWPRRTIWEMVCLRKRGEKAIITVQLKKGSLTVTCQLLIVNCCV